MTKYNYCCINDECEETKNFIHIKEEEDGDVPEYCPTCKQELKLMGEIPYGGIGKFKTLSPNEKQGVLKKRSQKHFQKHIKDRRREEDLSHLKKKIK